MSDMLKILLHSETGRVHTEKNVQEASGECVGRLLVHLRLQEQHLDISVYAEFLTFNSGKY